LVITLLLEMGGLPDLQIYHQLTFILGDVEQIIYIKIILTHKKNWKKKNTRTHNSSKHTLQILITVYILLYLAAAQNYLCFIIVRIFPFRVQHSMQFWCSNATVACSLVSVTILKLAGQNLFTLMN
jgi:hypothetical protein